MATSSHRHTKLRPDTQGKLRKGVCENHQYSNPDTGEVGDCPGCASGKIQAVNVQRLSDFKCDVCGGRLTPIKTSFPTKIISFIICGLIVIGALVSCLVWFIKKDSDITPLPPKISVEKIIVPKAEYTLNIGDSTKIMTKIIPSEATDTTLIWTTMNPDIISVSNGLIKAISKGLATITISSNDGNTSTIILVNVTQKKVLVENIEVSQTECNLNVGDSVMIITKVTPIEATDTLVVWSSSNTDIAVVSDGLIKAVSEGKTEITAKSNDGNTSAIVLVKVTRKVPPAPRFKKVSFSGPLKNGYPHGHGVLTFKQRCRIDSHDENGRMANVGDYIQGEWKNGHLLMGHWFGQDNIVKEYINIGNALDPESDHQLYH